MHRAIFSKEFWRAYWLASRRSRRDTRARKAFVRISFWLVYIACWIMSEFFLLRRSGTGRWDIFADSGLLVCASLVVIMIRRSHRHQDELFTHSIVNTNSQEDAADLSSKLHEYLIDRAAITAALLVRASSEWCLHNKEIPLGVEVITRRTQNEFLRREGLWESLEPDEADLLRAADGHWTGQQEDRAVVWCEHLRLLRWTLGLDASLISLAYFPRIDTSLAKGVVERRFDLFRGKRVLAPWDVRVERDAADEYLVQVVAEIVARGKTDVSAEVNEWARALRNNLDGPSKDYVVGIKTIGELDDTALKMFFVTASARTRFAGYLVDILASEHLITFADWSASVEA